MDYFETAMESVMQNDELFTDFCLEAYIGELENALESDAFLAEAMESVGKDSIGVFTTYNKQLSGVRKEMNAAKKAGDYKTAAKKARECAAIGKKMAAACDKLPQDINAGSLLRIAMTIVAVIAAIAVGAKLGAKTGLGDRLANSEIGQKGQKAYGDFVHNQAMKSGKAATKKSANKAIDQGKKTFSSLAKGDFKGAKASAGKALSNAKNAASRGVGTINEGITNQKGFSAQGQATRVMQKAGAAAGAGIAGGVTAGSCALANFLSKRKGSGSDMNPNEKSVLFKLVKQDAKLIEKGYTKKAEQFEAMAKGSKPAKESFLDALESYTGMSFSDGEVDESAVESESVFNGFLDEIWA